ncbi:MAG: hypothetical protein ACI4TK_18805 [Agathobacter sp.]
MLSTIADILGILSFLLSIFVLIMSHSVFKYVNSQKQEYDDERTQLQSSLMALRNNIWKDNLTGIKTRSKLRTELYSYLQKYWKISSPLCLFHIFRSIRICRKDYNDTDKEKLCDSIDYLIARFNKKEVHQNE